MAKQFEVKGLEELTKQLETLTKNSYPMLKASLYPGAGVIADEIRKRCPTESLRNGLGISQMRSGGGKVDVAISFDGYDDNHFPLAELAAIYESGTSDRTTKAGHNRGHVNKQPFIRPAIRAARQRMTEEIQAELKKQINRIMED